MAKSYRVKQRRVPRIPKEACRNLKLWADGARDTVLRPHIESYADALDRGWKAERDYHRAVCNEYHVRIDWRLKDHEDPMLPLPAYDPIAIQEIEELTQEEEIARLARIKLLDARIRRWLKYRVKKLRKLMPTKLDFCKNPYAILLSKLSGITAPPKARQGYQQFMHECYSTRINPVVKRLWREGNDQDPSMVNTQPNAAFRAKVARDVFNKLPPDEQVEFSRKAKDEYGKQMMQRASLKPEDIQQCIDSIPNCVGPLIQGIQERTKFKFFLMYGGPTPRNDGEITAYHINFGRNLATQPVNYSSFKQEQHENYTHARWVEFLKSSYTEQDIKLTALSNEAKPAGDASGESDSDETDSSLPSDSDAEEPPPPKKQKKIVKKKSSSKAVVLPKPVCASTPLRSTFTVSSSAPPNAADAVTPLDSSSTATHLPLKSTSIAIPNDVTLATSTTPAGLLTSSNGVSSSLPKAPIPRAPLSGYLGLLFRGGKPQQLRSVSAAPQLSGRLQHVQAANQLLSPAPAPPRSRSADPYAMDVDEDSSVTASFQIPRKPRNTAIQPLPASMESQLPPHKKRKVTEPSGITRAFLNTQVDKVPSSTHLSATISASSPPTFPPSSPPSTQTRVTIPSPLPPPPPAEQATSPPPRSPSPESGVQGHASPGTSTLELMCPPEAAKTWFEDAFTSLTQQNLGQEFSSIVRTFTAIETSFNYVNPSKGVGARGRPGELTRWIASGRWRGKMPTVDKPIDFSAAWWAWWGALQPPWRQFSPEGKPIIASHGNDWKLLSFPGQNGILSIVMALYWWGCATTSPGCPRRGPGSATDWKVAVRDVSWMLDGLLLNLA